MKRIRVFFAAVLLAIGMVVLSGVSAQASTDYLTCHQYGGRVYNSYSSETAIRIYSSGPTSSGCGYGSVKRVQDTKDLYNFRDTDAFYVGGGWRCENQATGYNYYGQEYGVWFWLASDSVRVSLECHRYFSY